MSRFARYPSLEDRAVLVTGSITLVGETITIAADKGWKQ